MKLTIVLERVANPSLAIDSRAIAIIIRNLRNVCYELVVNPSSAFFHFVYCLKNAATNPRLI
jgi:hypothetical protein